MRVCVNMAEEKKQTSKAPRKGQVKKKAARVAKAPDYLNYGKLPRVCEQNSGGKGGYKRDGIRLRGICDDLKDRFYPHYTFKRAIYGPENKDEEVDKRSLSKTARRGMLKGIKVDKEIMKAHGFMQALGLDIGRFLDLRMVPLDTQKDPKIRAAIGLSTKMLSNTRAFLTDWHERKFQIEATQYTTGCTVKKTGTALDVVLSDGGRGKDKNWYIINTKVTSWRYYQKHTGWNMGEPYTDMEDSKQNQDQLQLLAETILWRKTLPFLEGTTHPEINTCDASHRVRRFPLAEWTYKKQEEFWFRL